MAYDKGARCTMAPTLFSLYTCVVAKRWAEKVLTQSMSLSSQLSTSLIVSLTCLLLFHSLVAVRLYIHPYY